MADDDRERGLYRKYDVRRVKTIPDQRGDEMEVFIPLDEPVFVLRYKTDPHARAALAAYADSCAEEYPRLAEDLRAIVAGW